MITIKGVIFDIGGVLIDPEKSFDVIFEDFARALGAEPKKMVALHARYLNRMLSGKMSAPQFFAVIKKEFYLRGNIERLWLKTATKHITLNERLLKVTDKMRAHYQLALLSNVSGPRSLVDREFDLYKHFDHAFLSYKLHMQKPSKRMFRYALKKMRLKPNEALFVDDKEANLNAARALGIKSVQFNNNAQLLTEFKRLGLV